MRILRKIIAAFDTINRARNRAHYVHLVQGGSWVGTAAICRQNDQDWDRAKASIYGIIIYLRPMNCKHTLAIRYSFAEVPCEVHLCARVRRRMHNDVSGLRYQRSPPFRFETTRPA